LTLVLEKKQRQRRFCFTRSYFSQVQYSTYDRQKKEQPYVKTEISLGQYKNKVEFNSAVDNITVRVCWFSTRL